MRDPTNSYSFEALDASNVGSLVEELSACHHETRGETRDPRYWQWRYVHNPAGGNASVVALRGGRVVGILGSTYVGFSRGGQHVVASMMGDLSVVESDRSWQCYAGLLERSAERAVADRVAFGYAFAGRTGMQLSRQLGAVCLARVPVHAGFLNVPRVLQGRGVPCLLSQLGWLAQPFVGLKRRRRGADDVEVRNLEGRFDDSFDALWSAVEKGRGVTAVRDAAYLNWRYVDRPDARYARAAAFRNGDLCGLVVFRSVASRRAGYLVEMFARDDCPQTLQALLSSAATSLAGEGVGLVSASFPAGSAESAALAAAGFRGWAGRLWRIGLTVSADLGCGAGPETDLSKWHFSLGDWLTH